MLGVYYILSIIGMTVAIGFILYLAISYRSFKKHRTYRSEKEEYITSLLLAYDTQMISLGEVISKQAFVNRVLVLDWLDQITKISSLRYINLNNVFVSSGNKLTANLSQGRFQQNRLFVAPEEFPTLNASSNRYCWLHDEREDVFRAGLIFSELNSIAYGEISIGYSKIIDRCLEINPAKRYKNLRKLRSDLRQLEGSQYKAQQAVIRRRAICTLVFIMIFVSQASFVLGYASSFQTPTLVMSIYARAPLMVEKETALGNTEWIDSNIRISDPDFGTVAISDGFVQGMYEGTTVLNGLYRGIIPISINVLVTQPQAPPFGYALIEDEHVRVSQYFGQHSRVEVFAGNTEALITDDELPVRDATFASPESMASDINGVVYVSDGNALRIIRDGYVKQADLQYIPHVLRCKGDELYILTRPFWDEERRYVAIIKWSGNNIEKIYERYAPYGDVATDFIIDDRNIYLLIYNRFYSETELLKLNNEHEFMEHVYTLPFYASSMDRHSDSQLFISAPYRGEILLFNKHSLEMKVFAGSYEEKGIIDGRDGRLYFPHRIRWHSNRLFVWDSNVLRQINMVNSEFDIIISLAGVVSSERGNSFDGLQDSHSIVFPFSRNADIVVLDENILISDPRNRVIWMLVGDRAVDVS